MSADRFWRYLLNHRHMSQDTILGLNVRRPLGRWGGAEVIALRNGKALTSKTRRKHVVRRVPVRMISLILRVRTIPLPVKDIRAWTLLETRISALVPFLLALTGHIRQTTRYHLSRLIVGRLTAATKLEKNTGEG